MKLGQFDRDLLSLLQQDSRRTITELASRLHVSRSRISERIDRLRDTGVIRRFTIEISDETEDQVEGMQMVFNLRLVGPVCRNIFAFIKSWPEIRGCWSVAGAEQDMMILVEAESADHIEELRDRLARHPDVKMLWTSAILRQWSNKILSDIEPADLQDQPMH